MRISQQMMTRNYLGRMSGNLTRLTGSNEKLSSQRKINKAYENVHDAGKALKIRKLVVDNERYLTTIRDAKGRSAAAEDALRNVNSLMIQVDDRVVEAMNGTMSAEDRGKIATEIEKVQGEIFQIMNMRFSDRFVFTSTGGRVEDPPFSKDGNGDLLYHGTPVDEMFKNPADGRPYHRVPDGMGGQLEQPIPYNAENYVDIGAGFRLQADGRVDPNSAFRNSYSGVESFGYGVSDDGIPQNPYSLLGTMVTSLRNNDLVTLGDSLDAIGGTMNSILTAVTEIGARSTTLDDASTRLEAELGNLYEIQNDLEGVDLAEEIMYNKQFEMSWMVTLQLGSKILPSSIWDFLR